VLLRLPEVAGVKGAEEAPVARVEDIRGPQPVFRHAPGGDVAAPRGQVLRQVAQNVDQLQPPAEADGVLEQPLAVRDRAGEETAEAEAGPELPHAAGDPVGVQLQLLVRIERPDPVRSATAEAQQVRVLAGRDRFEHPGDLGPVLGVEIPQPPEHLPEMAQQPPLPLRRARAGEELREIGGRRPASRAAVTDGGAHGGEDLAAAAGGDALGVGDRIGRPRQQVGQPQLGFDGAREDGERQVKGAGHVPQQALEVGRSDHDGGIEPQKGARGE
jgi:hypothetical protein